ncbi:MAG TPA: peptidoglycan -binding protein [Stellaceae bacterium]|nr:peptidoglycan -binding protein [Stellaceae bacterium]
MAISSRRQRRSSIDIWPGFVDALSQLVMVIVFVLLVFTAGQFYLTDALSGRDAALKALNAKINELSERLGLTDKANADLRLSVAQLSSQLQAVNIERDALTTRLAQLTARADEATAKAARTSAELSESADLQQQVEGLKAQAAQAQRNVADRDAKLGEAQTTIDLLNQQLTQLRLQLQQIAAALDASEAKSKDQQVQIADLGRRLNAALASKVEELARYRSEFFGRLREVLGDRPDIRVVGDRFVFQSEVLFGLASADLSDDAKKQLLPLAQALKEISPKIPTDINWVLRVDGHTDRRPINTPQFPSNWELSTARAISVVKFLIDQGIPSNRLVAAGFGDNQPIDPGNDEAAFRRNRRIELKLTER